MGEMLFWLLLLAVGGILFLQTLDFKVIAMMDPVMGPARFPRIVIGLLAFSILGLFVVRLIKKERTAFVFGELFTGIRLRLGALTVCYILILEKIGFVIATSLFLILATMYLYFVEYGSIPVKRTLIRSVVIVGSVVLLQMVFTKVMGVMLPLGTYF